jgi:cytochrome d ubiquinol oxidase subunit II
VKKRELKTWPRRIVPVVLLYQGWTYWVFRHRVSADTKLEY